MTNLEEKGIRISLHSNYLLRRFNASALQYDVFDSTLISVKGSKEVEEGATNTFVGITLYD